MESHEVRVHAYCLMKNHFHLQVETPKPNLKEVMQRLLSGYVVRFNLRLDERVQPALHAATKQEVSFEAIAAAVSEEFDEPWEALKDRWGHPARALASADRLLAVICFANFTLKSCHEYPSTLDISRTDP